ncbi:MAG: ferrous iron transport protein A [Acidobacteria bacterium]|nr:MAG: ferrous iron transport protein A [Acidobacteriota bacterium]
MIRFELTVKDCPLAPVRLCDLEEGCAARFHEASLDAEARDLLRALGLTSSSVVRLCKSGEPCIVQVRATRIGLSKLVAGQIYVIPESRDAV